MVRVATAARALPCHNVQLNSMIIFYHPPITTDLRLRMCCSAPPPNAAGLVLAAYSAAYVRWDAFAGASWALCIALPMWASASAFAATVPHAALWALAVHALGWYMQIHPGHAVFERRKPALLDSLSQASRQCAANCGTSWLGALL